MSSAKKPNPREIIVPEIVVAAGSGKSLRAKRRENAWHETEKIERQAAEARRRADEAKQKAKELAAQCKKVNYICFVWLRHFVFFYS